MHTNKEVLRTDKIEEYIRTGSSDQAYWAWPGNTLFERAAHAHRDLRQRLAAEVRQRAAGHPAPEMPSVDTVALTRDKVQPMVHGFFTGRDREVIGALLEKSVVFVTGASIEALLQEVPEDHAAWEIANLYLTSIGAETLGDYGRRRETFDVVGFSESTACYVTPAYFAENSPFADFIVHETAHIFHNCRRCMIGLPETRTRKCLLDIHYRKWEEFAYACEAFSCILERAADRRGRLALAAEFARKPPYPAHAVDRECVAAMVMDAVAARNGWKVIHAHCASEEPSRF